MIKFSRLTDLLAIAYPLISWGLIVLSAPQAILLGFAVGAIILWAIKSSIVLWKVALILTLMIAIEQAGLVPFHAARIYPALLSFSVLLSFYTARKKQGFLLPIVSKIKQLTISQQRRLRKSEHLWLVVITVNTVILTSFLFAGSWDAWALYSGGLSYILLGLAGACTVLIVHYEEIYQFIVIRVIHIFNFAIFGLMCIIGIPVIIIASSIFRILGINSQTLVQNICYLAFRYLSWQCRVFSFVNMEFEFHNNHHRPRLMLCNHLCLFDIVAMFSKFKNCNTFVNITFYRNPLLKPFIDGCGYIPINPKSLESSTNAFLKAKTILENQQQLVVFPEGTRSPDGKLGRMFHGGFRLALETQTNITPVCFTLDKPFLNKTQFFLSSLGPATLKAHILPDILVANFSNDRVGLKQLMDEFRTRIETFSTEMIPAIIEGNH